MQSTPSNDIFADRLRTARAKRELSQEALAKRANLQATAISHFETGTRKPSFDNLRRLADALDVTTDYLLGRVDEMQDLAGADRLHRHFDQLSSGDRDVAEGILKLLAEKNKGGSKDE